MWKALRYFGVIAVLAGGAAWLADQPGVVQMQWGDYQIETGFGIMALAVGSLSVLTALLYRAWLFLRRAPRTITGAWRGRRQEKGYRALTQGMVAVAAGDGVEARRQARRAEDLLKEPPLTMLLSAQAAQLNGDERAAERFFRAMTENSETEFLGLRGLLNQAQKRGDTDEALALTRRAYRLHPESDWVSDNLFELQTRAGLWLDAHVTTKEAVRNKHLGAAAGKRRQAVLTLQMSLEAAEAGDKDRAMEYARDALSAAPGFVPAGAAVAAAWLEQGKPRRAITIIERLWARATHPDLVPLYLEARGAVEALDRVKWVEKLHAANPTDRESNIAVATEALAANLWGKARDHLAKVGTDGRSSVVSPSARACRMMAELEEAENGDQASARQWLVRASMADPDPAWVCASCGHSVTNWTATCGNCDAFDSAVWQTPPHVLRLSTSEAGATASSASTDVALVDSKSSTSPVPPMGLNTGKSTPSSGKDKSETEVRPPAPAEG